MQKQEWEKWEEQMDNIKSKKTAPEYFCSRGYKLNRNQNNFYQTLTPSDKKVRREDSHQKWEQDNNAATQGHFTCLRTGC